MTSLLLTILPVSVLLINYFLLQYKIFPLIVSIAIINIILYFNFIVFWIQLSFRNNNYDMSKTSYVGGIIGSIVLLLSYCFIIRYENLVKPFSDFFGYFVIKKDLNNMLNTDKKNKPGIFLSILISIFKILISIVSFVNGILTFLVGLFKRDFKSPITTIIIDLNEKIKENEVESKEYLNEVNKYDNHWDILINSIPFTPGGIHKSGKKHNNNIISKFIDLPVDKYKYDEKLKKIFSSIPQLSRIENKEDIIKLLDRKFLISKIIWLLLIIIITQGSYMALIN